MEENEAQRSDGVVDPLANYWGLSLFPQSSAVPSKPYNPDHDLDAIHNHLRSMALRSPNKLLEQTKSILDGNPGLFNSKISSDPTSDERNDAVAEEAIERPLERRPALGLKRARFSLKPSQNPPIENLLPPLDIAKLKDPVEFFLAHERFENAKREIQKQMGVSFEPDQDNTSTKPRQRRPGLFGNNEQSVRYRHRYSIETLDNNANVPSSQEAFGSDNLDAVGENTEKAGACLTSLENELSDSSAMQENNKLNDILDGLLHCNGEDLEGGKAITLLQERLQIKPIVLEKLSVPDFPDNHVTDLKSLRRNLSKPRKALSNIDNLLKGMSNKTPLRQDVRSPVQQLASPTPPRNPFAALSSLQKQISPLRQDAGSPVQQLASPTPPRNPFAALSSLQKQISRSQPSVDPFAALEMDNLFTRNSSPADMINQELNLVGSGKPSNELNEHIFEDVITVSKTSSVVDTVRNYATTSGKSKEDNSAKSSNKLNAPLIEDIIAISEASSVEDTVRNCARTSQKSMEDNSREPGFDTNIGSNEPHVDMDVDIGGSGMGERVMDDTIGKSNFEANGPCELEEKAENMQPLVASVPTDDSDFNLVNPLDQSGPAGFQANATDECTGRSDDGPEQCLQVQEKTDGSKVPVNGQRKIKLRARREPKDKRLPRRQSLAAAGTSWKSGVRRSTRIRTRPLEYWRGERMVYGRVHESLATVIGVKCMSPGSDGKPTMKVKSYVSDEYKELLELASLY